MLQRLYALIWLLLYLLASLYETLRWLWLRLHAATLLSYDRWLSSSTSIRQRDRTFLERCRAQLSKLPSHLSVIVGPDAGPVDEETLRRLFTYALIMDIDCVSLYDTRLAGKGRISLDSLSAPDGLLCKKLQQQRVVWTMSDDVVAVAAAAKNGLKKAVSNGAANGHISHTKSIEIYEVTAHDGRPLITDVCRDLFRQRRSKEVQNLLKDRTRLTERISDELSRRLCKLPDPELCLIFSRQMCTYGLLPWQTRFTEFHTHETGRHFDAASFATVLYKFSRCDQRWGK